MDDWIPPQTWVSIALIAAAIMPARYVIDYVRYAPSRWDVTGPRPDIGWRTYPRLLSNLAIGIGSVTLSILIWTPTAKRFAQSAAFAPTLFLLLGGGAIISVVRSLGTGRASPFIRGISSTFDRAGQPKRYWSSLLWNGVLGLSLTGSGLWFAIDLPRQMLREECTGEVSEGRSGSIDACNRLIAKHDLTGTDLAKAIADRGSTHYRAGHYALALADYRSAVRHGDDSSAIWFNQGLANTAIGETLAALRDYTTALDRDPDNIDAHLNRGILALNTGNLQVALNDFNAVLRARSGDVDARANRGLTHVWRDETDLARADFAAVRAARSQHSAMLHGEAVLAQRAGDTDTALSYLDAALRADPNDRWALERRSATFKHLGNILKAAADLERLRMVERAQYRRQYEQ